MDFHLTTPRLEKIHRSLRPVRRAQRDAQAGRVQVERRKTPAGSSLIFFRVRVPSAFSGQLAVLGSLHFCPNFFLEILVENVCFPRVFDIFARGFSCFFLNIRVFQTKSSMGNTLS